MMCYELSGIMLYINMTLVKGKNTGSTVDAGM